jgi:hypothetical protein
MQHQGTRGWPRRMAHCRRLHPRLLLLGGARQQLWLLSGLLHARLPGRDADVDNRFHRNAADLPCQRARGRLGDAM